MLNDKFIKLWRLTGTKGNEEDMMTEDRRQKTYESTFNEKFLWGSRGRFFQKEPLAAGGKIDAGFKEVSSPSNRYKAGFCI